MSFNVNPHVNRLRGYLPFDSTHQNLFQEYVDQRNAVSIPTVALDYLVGELDADHHGLVVLTGDAGHGKTHLCAKVLEHFGLPAAEIAPTLLTRCDGSYDLVDLPSGRALRIVKDLSELAPLSRAVGVVSAALEQREHVLVVCANEGRLRDAVSLDSRLWPVVEALELGLTEGRVHHEGVTVLNLNFQSVAGRPRSLVDALLRDWAVDARRWRRACDGCEAKSACPIFENHRLLSAGAIGAARREGLETLMRMAEQIGAVVTIREMLTLVAYALTGGLDCASVHRRSGKDDWQHAFLFHENIFGERLTTTQRGSVRSLRQLRLLDPGGVSVRRVDEALLPDTSDDLGWFVPPQADDPAAPTTKRQARRRADDERSVVRFLRRRDYFNQLTGEAPLAERAGLRFFEDFERVLDGLVTTTSDYRRIRDQLLEGLEAVQGLRRGGGSAHFFVVDPAFAGTGDASLVARRIANARVRLVSQSGWWRERAGASPELPQAVDWTDRRICLVFEDGEEAVVVQLDLLQAEFVMRSAEGLNARAFFSADVRRINAQIASLVSADAADDEIHVIYEGGARRLVIDVGDLIRSVAD
ncbi:MAG TPA: hypothetical protein VGM80_04710 [Gaiellaceae bacterium]|jgi:hypothetical protein